MKNTGSFICSYAFGLMLFFVASHLHASAQTDSLFVARLDALNNIALHIIEPAEDSLRLDANSIFQDALRKELLLDSALQNDFSSLRTVSVLESPKNTFRIATWYVPLTDGTFRFFGFIQKPFSSDTSTLIIELNDESALLDRPVDISLGVHNWFGAFYYELIHIRYRRRDLYLLLGWKGNDRHTRMRVIEPFRLENGDPVFGDNVFQIPGKTAKRIIFEYSSRASMSLNYYPEFVFRGKKGNSPAIVFDRLAPLQPDLTGNYRFYVPVVNIFDALRFHKGRWDWVEDIDARVFINPALQPLNPVN